MFDLPVCSRKLLLTLIAGGLCLRVASAAEGHQSPRVGLPAQTALTAVADRPAAEDRAAATLPGGPLSRKNLTPLPSSRSIVAARWSSMRYSSPANQRGDILPTVWGDDGSTYVMMDDGGVDVPERGGLWRQSLGRVTGTPPSLRFLHVGNPFAPPPRTFAQIHGSPALDTGPLGPYYSSGLTEVDHVFYATQERDWNWNANANFAGLNGIAYSTNRGGTWHFPDEPFGAPLGNLTWVARGPQGGSHPGGYVYALGTEREFNASLLFLGRTRPGIANITDPSRWQWLSGWNRVGGELPPQWTGSVGSAVAVVRWTSHITYPQMSYDAPLRRYLLTFTYSYSPAPPRVWTGGAELIILEAAHPWGPFLFVAGSRDFGPSNGYDPGFPPQWISANGRDLWLKWAANFDGCSVGLNCSGKYGFNVAEVHLTVARRGSRR